MDNKEFGRALADVAEAFNNLSDCISRVTSNFVTLLQGAVDLYIYIYATPKEKHFMLHAKRRRVRKKYRNRVIKRIGKAANTI